MEGVAKKAEVSQKDASKGEKGRLVRKKEGGSGKAHGTK